ncbi:MAG: FMN-binding protein [Clostridia bacterium]|nr:FMN-binding protein [Clostridia bacterium]
MKDTKEIIKSVVVLVVICLVVSGLLAVVNSFTAPVSAANAEARAIAARQEVVPAASEFEAIEKELPACITSAYLAKSGSNTLGYIFTVQGQGFGGTIEVMCAIDPDGRILSCKTMDVSSETSTLGGKTANPEYTEQYAGKDASLEGVNAVSHATITSTAYRGCVENAFAAFELVKEAK